MNCRELSLTASLVTTAATGTAGTVLGVNVDVARVGDGGGMAVPTCGRNVEAGASGSRR